MLIKYGANIHIKDEEYGSLLHRTAAKGNLETFKILIKYGLNMDEKEE